MKHHPTIKMLRYLTRYLQMFVKKQKLDLQSLGYAEILGGKKATPKAKATRKPKAKPASPPKSPPPLLAQKPPKALPPPPLLIFASISE